MGSSSSWGEDIPGAGDRLGAAVGEGIRRSMAKGGDWEGDRPISGNNV